MFGRTSRLNRTASCVPYQIRLLCLWIAPPICSVAMDYSQQKLVRVRRLRFRLGRHDYDMLVSRWKEGLGCVLDCPVGEWIVERLELGVCRYNESSQVWRSVSVEIAGDKRMLLRGGAHCVEENSVQRSIYFSARCRRRIHWCGSLGLGGIGTRSHSNRSFQSSACRARPK